jgi:hypothetical protein
MRGYRRLYARRSWRRPWLWDIGATLGVANGLFVAALAGPAAVAAGVTAPLVTVGLFVLADRSVAGRLPSLSGVDSAFVLVRIPAAVVFLYGGVVLLAGPAAWRAGSGPLVAALVLVAANAAVLSGVSLLVARTVVQARES